MPSADSPEALRTLARADLAALGFPRAPWVVPTLPHEPGLADVLIVGGGQSGLMSAAALTWDGLARVAVLDAAPHGAEGPWTTFARMAELRTPKSTIGIEFNVPNLSVRAFIEARDGAAAWERFEHVPREDWKAYLDWYADVFGLTIENDARVIDLGPDPSGVRVTLARGGATITRRARTVVLATGYDGAGGWRVPAFIADALPRDRYDHTNQPLDPARLRGKRIGVLGHGAAAFDNAVFALQNGAAAAEVSFRRAQLPRVNPHRALENAGLMANFPDLADLTKWRIARYFRSNDQPPPIRAFEMAMAQKGFSLRPATPWLAVRETMTGVRVTTPHGELEYDHLLLATGVIVDLALRPELTTLRERVLLWRDRFQAPPGEEDARLDQLPYLDAHYGFQPRAAADSWVSRVFAFNFSSIVSHGPHSTAVSGHRYCLPRLVRGVGRRLLLDHEAAVLPSLLTFRPQDLPVDDDFEAKWPRRGPD